jgi:regulator of protease activity HflC (stomatin/prohibitin superfamily)
MSRTFGEGLHVIYPWDHMDIYDARVQEMRETVSLLTRQGLAVSMTVTARFSPRYRELPRLHVRLGPDYKEKAIWPEIVSALRRVVGKYTPEELYVLGEDRLLAEVTDAAARPLSDCFVQLDRVLLTKLVLPERVQNAIQEKTTEEQKVMTYAYLMKQAELEKQRRSIEASGISEFERVSKVSVPKWRGIEAIQNLAASPNAKVVVIGGTNSGIPVVLNPDK